MIRPRVVVPLRVHAVAFDLDGTLLDTLPDIARAADRMLVALGLPPAGPRTVRRYVGSGISRLTKRLLTGSMDGEPPAEQFAQALALFERCYREDLCRDTQPFPGVPEGLELLRAKGLRFACVTNKAESFTLPLLERTGLARYFEVVVGGDTLPQSKPHPGPLLHCARRFGVAPARLLVIGDSDNDTRAARAAGCPVFCVPYGYGEVRDLDCDAIVATVIEAASLVVPDPDLA